MNFIVKIKNFTADESGAVTVDWVVLTAAIVGLGIAVIAAVSNGVGSLGERISEAVADQPIGPGGGGGTPDPEPIDP